MSATTPADEIQPVPERRAEPLNEVGALPDPEPEITVEPNPDVPQSQADYVLTGQGVSPSPVETESDSASEPAPEPGSFTREIPGAAGHGPARAYGYIAVATALGATAELTQGGTRSTSAHPLIVTVQADADLFAEINDLYDSMVPVAEQTAAQKRDEIRKANPAVPSYDLGLATRAVLAGFPQGAASALREPGTTKPAPLREATRARRVDEGAHRSAVASGRAWARHHFPAARDRQSA